MLFTLSVGDKHTMYLVVYSTGSEKDAVSFVCFMSSVSLYRYVLVVCVCLFVNVLGPNISKTVGDRDSVTMEHV